MTHGSTPSRLRRPPHPPARSSVRCSMPASTCSVRSRFRVMPMRPVSCSVRPKPPRLVHFLGTEFRWATGQATAARAIGSGVIGTPRLASFLLQIPLSVDTGADVPDWWSDGAQGGGWLGAHCSHVIDQVRTTLGEFGGLSAATPQRHRSRLERRGHLSRALPSSQRRQRGSCRAVRPIGGRWFFMSRIVGTDGTLWIEGDTVKVAGPSGSTTPGCTRRPHSPGLAAARPLTCWSPHTTSCGTRRESMSGLTTRLYRAFAKAIRVEPPASIRARAPSSMAWPTWRSSMPFAGPAATGTWETVDDS